MNIVFVREQPLFIGVVEADKNLLGLLTCYLGYLGGYPSCPKGRDLNFSLKESSDGARTTASGRLFQELCEKKLDLFSVRGQTASQASGCYLAVSAVTE